MFEINTNNYLLRFYWLGGLLHASSNTAVFIPNIPFRTIPARFIFFLDRDRERERERATDVAIAGCFSCHDGGYWRSAWNSTRARSAVFTHRRLGRSIIIVDAGTQKNFKVAFFH